MFDRFCSQLSSEIVDIKAENIQQSPLFVESVDELNESGDTTKLYVLPDGYLYAYMMTEVESKPSYTNVLPLAIDTNGSVFNGTGYKNGYRLNSSATEKEQEGCAYTGFIAAKNGDTIRIKNYTQPQQGYHYIHLYNSSFTKISSTQAMGNFVPDENGVFTYTIPADCAFIRISIGTLSTNTIITINEEIVEGGGGTTTGYAWANTSHAFVPADYDGEIERLTNITDAHSADIAELKELVQNDSNNGGSNTSYTNQIPLSTDTNRVTIYNGTGYKVGYRLSGSTGLEVSSTNNPNQGISGFISAKAGDILRIKGFSAISGVASYVIAYDGDNNVTGYVQNPSWSTESNCVGYAEQLLDASTFGSDFNAIRLSLNGLNADTIATINEEIKTQTSTGGSVSTCSLMFISPDGSDSNDGLTANTPKKTVKACVNAGATRISAKRGVYNEIVQFYDIGELEIFPTDNDLTYAVGQEREPIVFDTSDSIAVSSLIAYNSIKRVSYSNSANTQFDKVFTKKSQTPIYGGEYGSRYNATVWLLSDDEKTVCIKLKPVLTVAECESAANTFTYVDGYVYINADMVGVDKIVIPTNWDCGIFIKGCEKFVLKEVEVRFAGSYNIDIRNCAYFDFYKCACKYTSYGSGFHPFNSNGTMTACYATKNYDGFGVSGYGHTTYIDCVSEFNFDDGVSHHDGTEGTFIGGRYEGNGKGGNTPAYGAKVNIYGGIYKDNASFGIGYLYTSTHNPASGIVQGAVMVGNPVGLSVNANCTVTAVNCTYKNNTTDKENKGNLTEY